MKTYSITDSDGHAFAIEIENAYIGTRKIAALLEEVDGVTNIRKRTLFRGSSDVHVEFKYADKEFVVWEPYGDNSRYWIGPKNDEDRSIDIKDIEDVFQQYKPSFAIRIAGDLITLNVKSLLGRG